MNETNHTWHLLLFRNSTEEKENRNHVECVKYEAKPLYVRILGATLMKEKLSSQKKTQGRKNTVAEQRQCEFFPSFQLFKVELSCFSIYCQ